MQIKKAQIYKNVTKQALRGTKWIIRFLHFITHNDSFVPFPKKQADIRETFCNFAARNEKKTTSYEKEGY